jgi:hypothetical protein
VSREQADYWCGVVLGYVLGVMSAITVFYFWRYFR